MVSIKSFSKSSLLIFSQALLFLTGCSFQPAPSQLAKGREAMVVTENHFASRAALKVLEEGGNAFDAAITASFMLAVARPHSTGIGGGGFFLVKKAKQKKFFFLDARERAPSAIQPKSLANITPKSERGKGMMVGIPGIVAGLEELYGKFGSGKLSWHQLIQPSINLANNGVPLYPHLKEAIALAEKHSGFERPEGSIYDGKFINAPLAKSLTKIASKGSAGFYHGEIAEQILWSVRSRGGLMDAKDLKSYRPIYRKPLAFPYKGYKIITAPLPSSGGVVLAQMFKLREAEQFKQLSPYALENIHFLAETASLAFEDRARYLGDPGFNKIPLNRLTSDQYIAERKKLISRKRVRQQKVLHSKDPTATSTTHFSIVDQYGNIVSSTQSINLYFGAGFLAGDTGIFLNNTLDDFSKKKNIPNAFGLSGLKANYAEGGKTPLSSMTPTIVEKNGRPSYVLGSPGGPRIINAIAQSLINVIDYKMPLQSAVAAGRIHQQWQPKTLYFEPQLFPKDNPKLLEEKGHQIKEASHIGNISAISIDAKGNLIGVADPRRHGSAVGY